MFIDFIDIILSAGPFLIFAGMGESECSGKLLFKGLTSSDSTVGIIQDGNSLTFSSNSSGSAIDQSEIVFGTGTGITSSIFCVDTRSGYESITGAGVVSTVFQSNTNNFPASENNIILGGSQNVLTEFNNNKSQSSNNVILGGFRNCDYGATISGYGRYNSTISGTRNTIINANSSSIISSEENFLDKTAQNSSIISSKKTCLDQSSNSSIISSECVCIKNNSSEISLISSKYVCIRPSNYSAAISSYNSILAGSGNILISVENSSFGTNSHHSSIFSSTGSYMNNTYYSAIMSGYKNSIIGQNLGASFSRIFDSNIFTGQCNCLSAGSLVGKGKMQALCSSTIFSGSFNCIIAINTTDAISFGGSVILAGCKNTIQSSTVSDACKSPINGLVIGGGTNNIIDYSYNNSIITNGKSNILSAGDSAILSSVCSSINTSKKTYSSRNIIISSYKSTMNQPVETYRILNSAIISSFRSCIGTIEDSNSGKNNVILSTDCSMISSNIVSSSNHDIDNNIIIGGKCLQLQALNSSIIGGYKNFVYDDGGLNFICNSTIIGGECNCIRKGCNNSIIGGYKGTIETESYNSAIIGGSFSRIQSANRAVIVGANGLTNSFSDSTMFGDILITGDLFHKGLTGFTGTWTSTTPTQLKAKGGIIIS